MPSQIVDTPPGARESSAQYATRPRSTCCASLASWAGQTSSPLPSDIDLPALEALDQELLILLRPMATKGILAEIEALRGHYGEWADRSPGQARRLHRDWLEDLADAPGVLIVEACRRWRRASNPPNRRPPHTAGELIALISHDWGELRFLVYQSGLAKVKINAEVTNTINLPMM